MNKTMLIIISLLVISVLVLSGCQGCTKEEKSMTTAELSGEDAALKEAMDEATGGGSKAKISLAEISCEAVDIAAEQDTVDHCYQKMAIMLKEPNLCLKISDDAPKSKCFLLLAGKIPDVLLCSEMKHTSGPFSYKPEECFQKLAMTTGDSKYCNLIGETYGDRTGSDVTPMTISREKCLEEASKLEAAGKKCGYEEGPCCDGECGTDQICKSGKCIDCGHDEKGVNDVCCKNNYCFGTFRTCVDGVCQTCGDFLKECCRDPKDSDKPCMNNYPCINGICQYPCGEHGQQCCEGDKCLNNLPCVNDVCQDCGKDGKACCMNKATNQYTCFNNAPCKNGICE